MVRCSSAASTNQDHRRAHRRSVTSRRAAGILLLLLLASAALPADAQAPRQSPSLSLYLDNPMRAFNGTAAIIVDGTLTMKLAAPDPSAQEGIRVTYRVEGVIPGTSARVDPPEDDLHAGATGDLEGRFMVIVESTGRGSAGSGILTVVAQTQSTLLTAAGEAQADLAIRGYASNASRDQGAAAAGADPPGNASRPAERPSDGAHPPTSGSAAPPTPGQSWRDFVPPSDLRLQSNHEDEPGGGTFLFVVLMGGLGAYAGHRLRKRFV